MTVSRRLYPGRRRPVQPLRLAAVLLAGVLLLAACGGDSDNGAAADTTTGDRVEPRTWAETVCGSARQWLDDSQARMAELQQTEPPATPEEARDLTVDLIGDMADRGEQMMGEIEAAGTPDVDRGDEAQEAFVTFMQEVVDAVDAARDELEAMEPQNRRQFAQEVQAIMTRMQERIDAVDEERLDETSDPELDRAIEDVADCEAVAGYGDGS